MLQAHAYQLRVPFKLSYDHNLAKRACGDSVILCVADLAGTEGFGEATPRVYVTGEDSKSMLLQVEKYQQKVLEIYDGTVESIVKSLDTLPLEMMSLKSLFEGALLDYTCKKQSCSIFELFGVKSDTTIQYTASLSGGGEETFRKMLGFYAKNEMKSYKLKVTEDLEMNLDRIRQVQEIAGEDVHIRMDGNEIWDKDAADKQLTHLIDAGVQCFEQLFAKEDWAANDWCYKKYGTDAEFIVDESITDELSLQKVVDSRSIAGANLKISKNGGIFKCLEMAKKLREGGKTIRLGAHVGETSALTLAGMAFASQTKDLKEIEGAAGEHLLLKDPFQPSLSFGYKGQFFLDSSFRNNVNLEYDRPTEFA